VTVRNLGMFLADPLDVPSALVDYLAEQLVLAVAEDDDDGITVDDDEVLAVHGQRDAVIGGVTRSWPC